MSKLNTLDIPDSESGVQKTLQPGNTVVKINSIALKTEPFEGDPVNIILSMEGEDMGEGFEGFDYDKEKPELGKAKGQVGFVRAQPYTFSDGTYAGKKHNRDQDILKWLKSFCKAIGKNDWFMAQNNKHETVDQLIAQLNKDKPYKDVWFDVCLGGKAYISGKGFLNHDLYLPWFGKEVPLELKGTEPSNLIKFNKDMHILQPKEKKEVSSFSGRKGTGKDFEL